MTWQIKLASRLRATPLRCAVSRPNGAWLSCHQNGPRHFSSKAVLPAGTLQRGESFFVSFYFTPSRAAAGHWMCPPSPMFRLSDGLFQLAPIL